MTVAQTEDLRERLIEMFKGRVAPSKWKRFIAGARQRADEQDPCVPVALPQALGGPGENETSGCE